VKRFLAFFVASTVALTIFIVGAPAAQAVDCSVEHGLAVQKPNQNAYGSQGVIYAYKQAVDSCNGPIAQTQLIILSSDNKNWVEVGYRVNKSCVLGVCSIHRRVFGEWGYLGMGHLKTYDDVTPDTAPVFKVENPDATQFNWRIWFAPYNGASWQLEDNYTGMYAQWGWALGEVSKYGGSGATAFNHEWDLKFLKLNAGWNDWGGINCPGTQGWDTLGNYHWDHFQSNTEFSVVDGSGYC